MTAASATLSEPALQAAWEEIQGHLVEDHRDWELPGLAATIVVDGRTRGTVGLGHTALEDGAPVGPRTRWRVGALAQPLLATAMGHLQEQGRLALDEPVRRLVPEVEVLTADEGPTLTLEHLAAHAGGLPPMPPLTEEELSTLRFPEPARLLADLQRLQILEAPGQVFSYSNLGWALLSIALERAAGQPITDYTRDHVLRPLGMADTGWWSSAPPDGQAAVGHAAFGDPPQPAPTPRSGAFAPLWDLWSTAEDMGRLIALHLRSDPRLVGTQPAAPSPAAPPPARREGDNGRPNATAPPVSVETLRQLQRPVIVDHAKHAGSTPGWLLGLMGDTAALVHGAADPGFAAYAAVMPRLGLGVFLAANRASNPEALGEMAHGMLDLLREGLER